MDTITVYRHSDTRDINHKNYKEEDKEKKTTISNNLQQLLGHICVP